MFDTIQKLGWNVDVRKHIIKEVITKVLETEDVEWEEGRKVPVPREEEDCVVSALFLGVSFVVTSGVKDCFKWEFGNFKDYPVSTRVI